MAALNAASTVVLWVVHQHGPNLTVVARVLLAVLAVGNAFLGLRCAVALMRDPIGYRPDDPKKNST